MADSSYTRRARRLAGRGIRYLLLPAGTVELWHATRRWARSELAGTAAGRVLQCTRRRLPWPPLACGLGALAVLAALALALPAPAHAALPPWLSAGLGAAADFFDMIETIFTGFLSEVKSVATVLLSLLIGIELAVSGAKWGLRQFTISEMFYRLGFKALIIGMAFAIIQDTASHCSVVDDDVDCPVFSMEYVRDGFVGLATTVTGRVQPYYPQDVFFSFGKIIEKMWKVASSKSWLTQAWLIFILAITTFVLFFEYIIIAVKVFALLLEAILAIAIGLVFVAFLGFRGTAGMGERYITWILSISVELFLINLLIYAAQEAIPEAYTYLLDTGYSWEIGDALLVPMFGLMFLGMVLYMPRAAARHLTSGLSLGIRNVMRL